MILTDTRLLTNLKILSESKDSNTMKIRGIFQRADEVNNNKRIYPKSLMEKHVAAMQYAIKENRLCGELDHPAYDVVKLSNASHKITMLEMQDNDVIGEALILSTPAGMVAQALIRDGVAIGISSRGTGNLVEGKNGSSIVKEYNGITYDLVADPSTRGAFPSLSESKVVDQKAYILGVMNKVFGEKVLVRMIENSVNALPEGLTTGQDPYATGKRIGQSTPNSKKSPSIVKNQLQNIMKKLKTKDKGYIPTDKELEANRNTEGGGSFKQGLSAGQAQRDESSSYAKLLSKLEEIAQSVKTIKLARAKRSALASRGFGNKKSLVQTAKDDANPEHQAKMQAKRHPMIKAAFEKRKASVTEDSVGEGTTTGGDVYDTAHRVGSATPNPKKSHAQVSKQRSNIKSRLISRHSYMAGKDNVANKVNLGLKNGNARGKMAARFKKAFGEATEDSIPEGKTTGGDPYATTTRVFGGLPKSRINGIQKSMKKATQASRIFKKLDKRHPGHAQDEKKLGDAMRAGDKIWRDKQVESSDIPVDADSNIIMEIFNKFGGKSRFDIARDGTVPALAAKGVGEKDPDPKKTTKAFRILKKLGDRATDNLSKGKGLTFQKK